jgi:hypothetical protein
MNRVPGACRTTWTFRRVTSSAGSSRSSTSGPPLAGDVPDGHDQPSVADRQDVVEIAADGVRRAADPDRLDARRAVHAARQHRLLDLARDLQVVLQRQAVRHLQQHEEVHQREPDQHRPGPLTDHEAGDGDRDVERPPGHVHQPQAAEQVDQPEDREEQRSAVHRAARRRQLHREGEEQQAGLGDQAHVPRQPVEHGEIQVAREEVVRVARVTREEPLQIFGFEILRVGVEEFRQPARLPHRSLRVR